MKYDTLIKLASIYTYFLRYLGRIPDPSGLLSFMQSGHSNEEIKLQIIGSDECRRIDDAVSRVRAILEQHEGKRKLLLFGAFGNGNLGDREMARVVAGRLEQNDRIVCFAYSELTSADYPFHEERKLDRSHMPLHRRVMGLFDGLVIGGGGLLYYTHEPLWETSWNQMIPIPYAILACGVASPLDPRLRDFVASASAASSRDLLGLAELTQVNEKAFFCPDPILSYAPESLPLPRIKEPGSLQRLFILRAPLRDWHNDLRKQMGDHDAVGIFEAHMDFSVAYFFGATTVVSTIDEFIELIRPFDVVVTDRYHAAILALLCGRPVIGLCKEEHTSKMSVFFQELGLSRHCYSVKDLPSEFVPYDVGEVAERIKTIRAGADASYDKLLSLLLCAADDEPLTISRVSSLHAEAQTEDADDQAIRALFEHYAQLQSDAEAQLADVSRRETELRSSIAFAQSEIAAGQAALSQSSERYIELQSALAASDEKVTTNELMLAQTTAVNTDLVLELSAARAEASARAEHANQLARRLEEASCEALANRTALQESLSAKDELAKLLAKAREQLSDANDQIALMTTNVDHLMLIIADERARSLLLRSRLSHSESSVKAAV